MSDEANESLPLSSPPLQSGDGDGDGEPGGDDTASPVLRRLSSTGMGSCCEDGKLEGESLLLGDGYARSDEGEANGGGGDRSLEVELGEHEVKGANLEGEEGEGECPGVQGLELEKATVHEVERVDNDCAELVSGAQEGETVCFEASGVEDGNVQHGLDQAADVVLSKSDFEGCEAKTQPASEMVDEPTDTKVEVIENGVSRASENGHGKLVSVVQEGEDEWQGGLEVKDENMHIALEQSVEVGIAREELDFAHGVDQILAVEIIDNRASVDSGSGLREFILGEKADEEESKHLGLAQKLEVEAPEPVEITDTVVSVKCVSRSDKLDSLRKDDAEELLGISGVEEETRHLGLKQTLVPVVPKLVTKEEHDEFPGLSPLRTLETGDFGGSVSGIGSEVGFLSSGVFDSNRVRNRFEDTELLVSSGLAADFPLVKISRDDSKPADGHCFPHDASQDLDATCTVERFENLHCFEVHRGNFGQCSGNELCSKDGNRKGDQFSLKIGQSLSLLHYVRSQKEHCGDNIGGHYSICPQETAGRGEVDRSVQGSPDEVASFPAVRGLKPSHFFTSTENFSSKLASSPDFQGSEVDAFIGMSACSSNVNGSCGEADNGGISNPKSSSTIVLRRSNPKRGASLRSNLADNQLCGTRNNRRNGRKMVDITSTFLLSAIKISDKLKRKRSWPHRAACSSVWGPVENLIKIFNQNVKPANYDVGKIHIQNKRSKERPTVGNKSYLLSQKDGNFQVSSAKHSATSYQPVCHIVVGLSTADCQINFGNFKAEAEHKLAGDKLDKFFAGRSLKQDGQPGDKDMESSLTQEASVELGECPGVSSQIAPEMLVETVSDRNSHDPGTSPDSDVYHPVIDVGIMTTEGKGSSDQPIGSNVGGVKTSESATSANQFRGMRENVPVQGAVFKDDLYSAVSICSKACVTPLSVPPLDPNLCAKAKKGIVNSQVKEKQCLSEHLSIVEELPESENMNKNKKPSKGSKSKQKKRDVINEKNRSCSKSMKKTTTKGSKCMSYAMESSVPETAELECLEEPSMVQNCLDSCVLPVQAASTWQSEALLQIDKTKGHKLSSGTKPGASKARSHRRETAGQRRQNVHRKMGKRVQESDNRCQDKCQTADTSAGASDHLSFFSGTVNPTLTMSTPQNCKTNVGSRAVSEDVSSLDMSPLGDLLAPNGPTTSLEQPLLPQVAWVLCDECEKWRCISVELANILEETKCKWACKDNIDKAFADCSIPQEKSNSEINAELGILDEEDPSSLKASANGVEPSKLADVAASQRTSWIPIKSNLFLRRNRRTQTIDEIMVCHCKPLQDGHRGCGDHCLNRMLNIECVKGTCPCGDLCSNQRFQKRKYAKFKWFRCGRKGYGLQLQQDVSRGQFLIEYVGEVLDLTTYEKRQSDYASRGQKHFYFMTLNGGEVIDACAKGNLGRFINHSCEPNCRTEKWMVNGEVCIGLFAIRNIKKGEEVTFDYNYVRVVGAAAKKCVCGSSECRGYIGGDLLNSEVIVQGDSDEEDIEPVMVRENSRRELNQNDSVSDTNDVKVDKHKELSMERKDVGIFPPMISEPEVSVRNKDDVCRLIPDNNMLDISLQSSDSMQLENTISRPISAIQPLGAWKLSLNSVQVEENVCKPISEIQQEEISLQAPTTVNEVSSDSVLYSKKLITNHIEEKPNAAKPHSVTKSSRSRSTIKRGRSNVKSLISHKTKTVTPGGGTSHFEGVEEKLNVLLDVDGGISKQRDATRGYLKLLFVTAAEGDVEDCGSQRNIEGHRTQSSRDLSLILDAILKTKSRKVLMDVINKNGLQMLHNIMKQNRNRIPIIRKLLKVFEFLAHEEILTSELINKAPPCHGMESFKESFLKLANHNDKQVHKIAREFRDKYIPRIRRFEPSDRDGGHLDRQPPYRSWIQSPKRKYQQVQLARDTDAIDTPGETFPYIQQASISASMTDNSSASGIKTRKRKSRWDHPSGITNADTQSLWSPEDQSLEAGTKFIKSVSPSEQSARIEVSKQTYGSAREGNSSWGEIASSQNLMQLDDERPPGFLNDEGPPGFLDEGPPGFLDEGPLGFLNDEGPPGFFVDEGPPGFEPSEKNHQPHLSSETALVKGEVLMGHPQEIYLSYMTMSYGIPVGLMQQLGTPETGGSPCNQNWVVAPGMPFYPFPPLPSYPREQPNPREERQRVHPASGTDLTLPSTSGGGPTDMVEAGCRNSQFHGRLRWDNHGCGRRFHHPQRWSNRRFQRFWPRWPYQRFGRGFRGNTRNGPSNLEVGNMRRDFEGGLCPPDGVNNNGGFSSNFHQPHN